ncbi:hypothetical protein B484DRAFT_459648 [Ochromonadaceae sp. CCMP2298]|nr:hypothetical protein B484DRAFT_459648 [Ochromonadaceae sp. CCMP2298]
MGTGPRHPCSLRKGRHRGRRRSRLSHPCTTSRSRRSSWPVSAPYTTHHPPSTHNLQCCTARCAVALLILHLGTSVVNPNHPTIPSPPLIPSTHPLTFPPLISSTHPLHSPHPLTYRLRGCGGSVPVRRARPAAQRQAGASGAHEREGGGGGGSSWLGQ